MTSRLAQIYTDLYIDEFQDPAGWDLELIGALLRSGIRITLVGDPRQHIYSTHPASKNKQYFGIKIVDLIKQWERNGLCSIENMTTTRQPSSSPYSLRRRFPGTDDRDSCCSPNCTRITGREETLRRVLPFNLV